MRIFLFIIWLLSSLCAFTQNELCVTMTEDQMLQDLSFLQKHIHVYHAMLPLHEQRTGIKIDKEFERLKKEISFARTNKDFLYIIRQIFLLLNDGHSDIANKQMILSKAYVGAENLDMLDADVADYYYSLSTDSIFTKIKCGLRSKYIKGKYYNIRPFTYKGIYVKAGEEISEINNIPINAFIQENYPKLYSLAWDDTDKQWYSEYFTFAFPLTKFSLKIGKNIIEINNEKLLDNLQREYIAIDVPKMMIINDDILYIRIPAMDRADWYQQELYKYYSSKITKIVLDVRGNRGGSDYVWWGILDHLIDKPFTYKAKLGFNKVDEILTTSPKIQFYEKDESGNINSLLSFPPHENSVHFKGKYYVLRDKDTFSSASSLCSAAWQRDDMVLIGEPSGPISGTGFPAYIFTLPNSRITFTLSYTVDLSGGKLNPYMNQVEKEVNETIDQYIDRVLHYDSYGVEYLIEKDKMIQTVIDDK